ncbi:MAG: hypothetical protein HKP48_02350 [Winogradskyella sp.]|uniref:hypothetical protein n=1 Tax=Winogradskyella sp. TaxID=1883156 RepID=UPI0018439092|nr:hypothetical protein [Winogradskyella sp.]MBT8245005.1 hypothetical protein [Winogradskyella sp.]NNK22153.1 hypothetical protein [Winogradskyella sp.]
MKKILIVFVFVSQLGFAQFNQQSVWDFQDAMARDPSKEIVAQGSQYIQKDFTPIKLNKFGDKVFNAKFNAYNGEMQVQTVEKTIALDINDDYTVTFLVDNKIYKTLDFSNKNSTFERGFLVVLKETEKYGLYKKETIKFQPLIPAKTSYDKEKPAKFKRSQDEYYVSFGDNVEYISTRKKDIFKAYPNHSKSIKKYIKEKKLSLSKDDDLVILFDFISKL